MEESYEFMTEADMKENHFSERPGCTRNFETLLNLIRGQPRSPTAAKEEDRGRESSLRPKAWMGEA